MACSLDDTAMKWGRKWGVSWASLTFLATSDLSAIQKSMFVVRFVSQTLKATDNSK